MIQFVECPRDAMQGIKDFIPTKKKVNYINSLLKVGFDTLDFGSFGAVLAAIALKAQAIVKAINGSPVLKENIAPTKNAA